MANHGRVTLGALATATLFWLAGGESTNAMMRMAPTGIW